MAFFVVVDYFVVRARVGSASELGGLQPGAIRTRFRLEARGGFCWIECSTKGRTYAPRRLGKDCTDESCRFTFVTAVGFVMEMKYALLTTASCSELAPAMQHS